MAFPTTSREVMAYAKDNVIITLGVLVAIVALFPIVVPLAVLAVVGRIALQNTASEQTTVTTTPSTTVTIEPVRAAVKRDDVTPDATMRSEPTAPVALTGSAALMAKMRKSAATSGEKRVVAPSAERTTTSARTTTSDGDNGCDDTSAAGRVFILHGGEAAREIAKELGRGASEAVGARVHVLPMDDFRDVKFDQEPCVVVFVVETVENAQPAEAAGTCVRWFNRKRKEGTNGALLQGKMSYAVLGLGDTNLLLDRQTTTAKDCNQAAQTLDSALAQLGATRIVARGEANDAVGLDEAVEPWSKTLFPELAKVNKALEDKKNAKIYFLYGSQTGNAAEICKNLAAEAGEKGYPVQVCSMNEVEPDDVVKPGAVITFVVSSTGDGDAPDNCDTFYTRLKRKTKKEAGSGGRGVQYTVLGLGDQNYSAFMAVPRAFTQIMENMGAKAFAKRGECDDTLGLYEQVDTWTSLFWPKLAVAQTMADRLRAGETIDDDDEVATNVEPHAPVQPPAKEQSKLEGVPPLAICRSEVAWLDQGEKYEAGAITPGPDANGAYTVAAPYMASICEHRLLTNPESDRRVLHVAFDLGSSGIRYKPGDSIGIIPQNNGNLTRRVVSALAYDGEKVFSLNWKSDSDSEKASHPLPHIKTPCTVIDAFQKYLDITSCPRKSLVRVLAEHCSDAADKTSLLHLSSRGGKADYDTQIRGQGASLLTLLERFPSCKPPLAELLDALPPLAPRLYSITCAPEVSPTTASVAFSVVKYKVASGEERLGVATNWLDALTATPASVPVYIKPSLKFGLPEDASAPLIMIGPGTGVAPFRGFLQSRREAAKNGVTLAETMLFFGCRKRDEDFLYDSDWEGFVADGALSKFVCAFSRETSEKVYVQHKLREHIDDVARLIANGAYIMVCGDGVGMAKDVHATLVEILVAKRVFDVADAAAAESALAAFTKSGRYVRDIWS